MKTAPTYAQTTVDYHAVIDATEADLIARDRAVNAAKNSGAYDRLADHRALSREVWIDSLTSGHAS